ncbi:MAG: L-aspartate oxidase [Candidatus Delongbacteria bacterium]|jgi:L-aspartate oxidase|nr:L-aspartate oxidase [Candidatus Delongbacteria bacterium]
MKQKIYDYLVIGSGAAGLYFSIHAAKHGKVLLLSKDKIKDSNTYLAQGGIASVEKPSDSFEDHIYDTLVAGDELCNLKAVEMIVKEAPTVIDDLIDLGAKFSKETRKGFYSLHKEGGHTKSRVFHFKDATGRELVRALTKNVKSNKNIDIMENAMSIDLLTEHQKKKIPKDQKGVTCFGAYVLDNKSDTVLKILAKATILATGGSGQVYLHTSNPSPATGDGIAMAYRSGATISNLEFFQFHPTTLYTGKAEESSFLISEAVRGFGGILKTRKKKEFMHKFHKLGSLAPRDIVARAIDAEMKKSGDPCVYIDVTNYSAKKIIDSFPNIYNQCLEHGIDITKEMIPVVPAAHYQCGGVEADLHGRTDVRGLYAIGEVAQNGVHGANRLASNSLLEALVFGKKAATSSKHFIEKTKLEYSGIKDWKSENPENIEEKIIVSYLKNNIKRLTSEFVGIVRSKARLKMATKMIDLLLRQVRQYYNTTRLTKESLELRNLADVASLLVRFAKFRKESRGLHYNLDYLEKDNENWQKNTRVRSSGRASKKDVN